MEPVTVAFFGISGSGKGTQVGKLEEYLKAHEPSRAIVRAEMGAMLREFMKGDSELAKRSKQVVDAGGLLPSFVPVFMLARLLESSFSGNEHLILDGTPRRPTQSELVDENVRFYGRTNLQAISFVLSPEEAKRRLAKRGEGRADDTEEAMRTRFQWYEEQVKPSIKRLSELGWTVHEVDADPDVDTIHKSILSALKLA